MSLRLPQLLILRRNLHRCIEKFSSAAKPKPQPENAGRQCVISCKRSSMNHFSDMHYSSLQEVPLASKGWNHHKAKDDWFTVNPVQQRSSSVEDQVSFGALDLDARLVEGLRKMGITQATAFQARAIAGLPKKNHVMLAAETGCGKTLAYLLPIFQNLIHNKSVEANVPKAVVVVPNRELAYQVAEVATNLAEAVDLRVKVIVGGRTKKAMLNPVFEDMDILIATPGAIGKLSSVGIYKLNQVTHTVLDEADTLLDDSFTERMGGLLRKLSQSKIVMVAATLPRALPEALGPIETNMSHIVSPNIHKPLLNVTQKFMKLTRAAKPSHLMMMAKANKSPMIVFSNRNETCNWLALFLRENGVACSNINGDMNFAIRIEQWNDFLRGKTNILSATDVASRGLDTVQVRHIVNYNFPLYAADYLHRVGRVGRLGGRAACRVTNFISGPEEVQLVQKIELAIRKDQPLQDVDGNITKIMNRKIMRELRQSGTA